MTEPITRDLIGRILDFYRAADSPLAVLQPATAALPADWNDICAEFGIKPKGAWVKLVHDLRDIPDAKTSLPVKTVPAEDAAAWGTTMVRGFGMPEEGLSEVMAGLVGRPGFHTYGAWDGDRIVATGACFAHEGVGQACGAATLEPYRGRGAQSALLSARLKAVANAGCRLYVAETWAEGEHNPSLHNMLRAGYTLLYERRNWLWDAAA